jgi:uncharacterized protein (DUF697 family)
VAWDNYKNQLNGWWTTLRDALIDPKVDDAALDEVVRRARDAQPLPVIWLLGRTQSGKTSIVRALTRATDAEIGNGFEPCTKTARRYSFPEDAPILQFLDTRGLGEVAYDPSEDLAVCKGQSHLILAVMRACEPPVGFLVETLGTIRRADPTTPIVVAQTTLHEGYKPGSGHLEPYPYTTVPLPDAVPVDLRRSLATQRAALGQLAGQNPPSFVPIDFTLPGDGLLPTDYGIEALWDAIELILPQGLRRLLATHSDVQDVFAAKAEIHIRGYTTTAMAVGALPGAGAVGLVPLQAKMLHSIAAIYGLEFNRRAVTEFLTSLGAGIGASYLLRMAGREALKLVPGFGQVGGAVVGAVSSAASTYALGQAACVYLHEVRGGGQVDPQAVRRAFKEGFSRARSFAASQQSGDAR